MKTEVQKLLFRLTHEANELCEELPVMQVSIDAIVLTVPNEHNELHIPECVCCLADEAKICVEGFDKYSLIVITPKL